MKWIFAFLLAVVIFGAAALFTYKIFIQPGTGDARRAQIVETPVCANAGYQPAGISGCGETQAGRQTDRSTRGADRIHPKISQRSSRRGSAGSARRSEHQYFALRLSGSGKRGIHCAQRRRPGADREQDQDHAGIDHADQQPEWHDAADRPEVIHLAPGIFHPHPARSQSFSTCSIAGISSSATISAKRSFPGIHRQESTPASRKSWLGRMANGSASAAGNILGSTRWIRLAHRAT